VFQVSSLAHSVVTGDGRRASLDSAARQAGFAQGGSGGAAASRPGGSGTACRLPMYNREGVVVGYRRDSWLRGGGEGSDPQGRMHSSGAVASARSLSAPATAAAAPSFVPSSSPATAHPQQAQQQRGAERGCSSVAGQQHVHAHVHAHAHAHASGGTAAAGGEAFEFQEQAAHPTKGFRDADNQVPGAPRRGLHALHAPLHLLTDTWQLAGPQQLYAPCPPSSLPSLPSRPPRTPSPPLPLPPHLPPPPPAQPPPAAGYVLGPVVGKGGFCVVHAALHQLTGRRVAVKVIDKALLADPKSRDRVDRECRVLRMLGGQSFCVRMLEAVEKLDYLYIVMEYCSRG
jgi:hypothetical protein